MTTVESPWRECMIGLKDLSANWIVDGAASGDLADRTIWHGTPSGWNIINGIKRMAKAQRSGGREAMWMLAYVHGRDVKRACYPKTFLEKLPGPHKAITKNPPAKSMYRILFGRRGRHRLLYVARHYCLISLAPGLYGLDLSKCRRSV